MPLIGGYAVGYHGYPRATVDLDVWVAISLENAEKVAAVLCAFAFGEPPVDPELFLQENKIVWMGMPPLRIEVSTGIDGVSFAECYAERIDDELDGVPVSLINLRHLKINKQASGRAKDINDLTHLP